MYCQYCSAQLPDNSRVCPQCGVAVPQPVNNAAKRITAADLPNELKPMGAWSYFGHSILFSIPIVGLIFLIVFAVGGTRNINKRNYARSFFCGYAVFAIIALIYIILALAGIVSYNIFN